MGTGGGYNFSVMILGSTTFNAFNISIHFDVFALNITFATLVGSILPGATLTADCINGGFNAPALRCGPLDGPGIAHVAATGTNTTAPAGGRLFVLGGIARPGVSIHLGYQTGCSTNSVPNTNLCVLVAAGPPSNPGITPVPESIQSQLIGPSLPTALSSGFPAGSITDNFNGGSTSAFADTFITPYSPDLPGNITAWKAQFTSGLAGLTNIPLVPTGIQIVVFRRTSLTTLQEVAAGPIHDPRPILRSRLPSYPFVRTEWTVTEFYSDSVAIRPGDLIGLALTGDPSGGFYGYPATNGNGTLRVQSLTEVGQTITLTSTLAFPNFIPAVQVFIRVPPPALSTAGDGLPDFVKLSPEMQALGADPCRKTVPVQIDYMNATDHSHKPDPRAIGMVTAAFDNAPIPAVPPSLCPYAGFPLKSSGIKLIVDVKNPIQEQNVLNYTHSEPQSFDTIKATLFDPNRVGYFHYNLWVHNIAPGDTTSGISELFGSDMIVSLGGWTNNVGSVQEQAGTFMHELGHNLGLDHGGRDGINFKPNYLSIMNYAFQVVGITTKTPNGNVTRFDYSSQALPSLNESSLDEFLGIQNGNDYTSWICPDHLTTKMGLGNGPLDWDCNNNTIESKVSADINNDTSLEILAGYNDWANLKYSFTTSNNFRHGGHIDAPAGVELTFPRARAIEIAWTRFFATLPRSTSTSVACNPGTASSANPTSCTATVTDIDTGSPVTPTGTIGFKSSVSGSFTPAVCTLMGTGASASCSVTYTPSISSIGTQTVSAGYGGDSNHLGSIGTTMVNGLLPLTVSVFFTDSAGSPLPLDQKGNPAVNVILVAGKVMSTNPGTVTAWVKVTNPGSSSIQSVTISDSLPVDWDAHPTFLPARGAVSVFFARTDGTTIEITNQVSIATSTGNPQTVSVAIGNLTATAAGGALGSGQSVLLAVNLRYTLIGTSQAGRSYPRNYSDTATANGWSMPSFAGSQSSGSSSALFTAYAKVPGDVNGDFNVDITDAALLAQAYGTKPGDALWNPAADFNNNGVIDIGDAAILAMYYGTSS